MGIGFVAQKKGFVYGQNTRNLGFGQRKTKKLAHWWAVIFVFGRKKIDFLSPTKNATRASS